MQLEPNVIVIYVDNLAVSSRFYQDLLGITPESHSPTFSLFRLSNGMSLGLKDKRSVEPSCGGGSGGGELAFTVTHDQVDAVYIDWKQRGVNIVQLPTVLPFAYTFLALDPDGNRLRVASLGKPEK